MLEKYKEQKRIFNTWFDKNRVAIGVVTIFFIIFAGTILMVQGARAQRSADYEELNDEGIFIQKKEEQDEDGDKNDEILDEIIFDIEGGVVSPGVYRLKNGSVIVDAVNIAGGFSADADRDRIAKEINQASLIGNNSKIYIFRNQDKEYSVFSMPNQNYSSVSPQNSTGSKIDSIKPQSDKININTASASELDSLSGIGPAIAQRIVDWREENGGFEIIDDIKKVKGIGDSIFDSIKGLIEI